MAITHAHLSGDDELIPPRYWWLRRLVAASLAVSLAVCILHAWWAREADRRLAAAIATYRTAGGPVTVTDFDKEAARISDRDNGVIWVEKAIRSLEEVTAAGDTASDFLYGEPRAGAEPAAVQELLAANSRSLEYLRCAWEFPTVSWRASISAFLNHPAASTRIFAKTLQLFVRREMERGNHAAALDILFDITRLGEAALSHSTLVSLLIGISIDRIASEELERVYPYICVGDERSSREPARAQLVDYVSHLLDERGLDQRTIRAWRGDRAIAMAQDLDLITWPRQPRTRAWVDMLRRPVYTLDSVRAAELGTHAIAAANEPCWPRAERCFPAIERPYTLLRANTHPLTLSPFGEPAYSRGVLLSLRSRASRRMAAVALALKLYESEHGYTAPSLDALLGTYLEAIPADPFSDDGSKIRYKLDGPHPLLYSIGANGIDQGGQDRGTDDAPGGWEEFDLVFRLDGRDF